MQDRYDPWHDADRRPDLDWLLDDGLPSGNAWWMPWLRLIVVRETLHPTEQRCALAHELVHVDHGDQQVVHVGPDGPRIARRQESRADREAARRLIYLPHLAAAMLAHPSDPGAVADELEVTPDVLRCRLEHLHPAERGRLCATLSRRDDAA